MKNIFVYIFVMALLTSSNTFAKKWDLASQAWTFKEFTLCETLVKMESLNLRYIELFPGQKMDDKSDKTTHFTMSDEEIMELKALLKKHKIKATSYGVVSPNKKDEWTQLFVFAQKMGIKTIVSEPKQELLPFVDELCQQYKISVAIHNHPNPTRYWSPEIVQKALEGRSKYIGVCPDLGHWTRSGLNAADCLKQLEGHILEVHTKDVNATTTEGHAVVWGEGIINWDDVFAELKRQKFAGKFVIEHEYNWTNPMPDLKKNIDFFNLKTQ